MSSGRFILSDNPCKFRCVLISHLQCFQTRLLFLQGCLFFSLIHFGERHASVGQGRYSIRKRACSVIAKYSYITAYCSSLHFTATMNNLLLKNIMHSIYFTMTCYLNPVSINRSNFILTSHWVMVYSGIMFSRLQIWGNSLKPILMKSKKWLMKSCWFWKPCL